MKRTVSLCVVLSLLSAPVRAQVPGSFGGTWRATDSTQREVWEVTRTDARLSVRISFDGQESHAVTWTLDGPPVPRGADRRTETAAVLNGDDLVFRGTFLTPTGERVPFEETWRVELREGGEFLRVLRVIELGSSTARNERMFAGVH